MKYEDKMEAIRKSGCLKNTISFKPMIGLHRTVIKNLHIESIDAEKLSNTCASYITDEKNYALANDGTPFSSISKISCGHMLNEFKARGFYKPYDDIWTDSISIDSSPQDYLKLFSLSDFHSHLIQIQNELTNSYGIQIVASDATFKSAEIAAEFILPLSLAEYSRAFHILKSVNTERVTKIDTTLPDDNVNRWQSCIYKKRCYELYVYDKTRQLYEAHNIILSENVIKIELRLPDTYLYQTRLKENIFALSDDDIQTVFLKTYRRIILNPFKKWYRNYLNNLNQLVLEYRSKYKRWISELYKFSSENEANYKIVLIDWQDILLCPCIKALDRRTQDRIKNQLCVCFKDTSYNQNTYQMLQDIFDAVEECHNPASESLCIYSNKITSKL